MRVGNSGTYNPTVADLGWTQAGEGILKGVNSFIQSRYQKRLREEALADQRAYADKVRDEGRQDRLDFLNHSIKTRQDAERQRMEDQRKGEDAALARLYVEHDIDPQSERGKMMALQLSMARLGLKGTTPKQGDRFSEKMVDPDTGVPYQLNLGTNRIHPIDGFKPDKDDGVKWVEETLPDGRTMLVNPKTGDRKSDPANLTATERQSEKDRLAALAAAGEVENLMGHSGGAGMGTYEFIKDVPWIGDLFKPTLDSNQQNFLAARANLASRLTRELSGRSASEQEYNRVMAQLPNATDDEDTKRYKMTFLRNYLGGEDAPVQLSSLPTPAPTGTTPSQAPSHAKPLDEMSDDEALTAWISSLPEEERNKRITELMEFMPQDDYNVMAYEAGWPLKIN